MIYLAVVSIIWAFSFGLIGSSLAGLDSFLVATLRLGVASVIFLFFLRVRIIGAKDRMRLVLIGAIQFGVMYGCYMKAFHYIPSHIVAYFFHYHAHLCSPDSQFQTEELFEKNLYWQLYSRFLVLGSSRHKKFLREIFGWGFLLCRSPG
jgi:hypothetical protein